MHYYTRNLGDYAKKAGRLSMLQHGAYTLLLDACYDRERFPTESEAIEWTWASTPEEEQAVRFVLSRFFELQQDGTYVQSRVKEELALFKIGGIQNRLIAISREAKKQKRDELAKACDQLRDEIKHAPLSKTHEAWTDLIEALIKTHEAPPNQEPITNNQEPIVNTDTGVSVVGDAAPDCPHQEIISLYHKTIPTGTAVRVWNSEREKHLRARWRENTKRQNLDWWRKFFEYAAQSEFLTGQTAPTQPGRDPFVVSLDWLINPQNFAKVIEGKYHQRGAA